MSTERRALRVCHPELFAQGGGLHSGQWYVNAKAHILFLGKIFKERKDDIFLSFLPFPRGMLTAEIGAVTLHQEMEASFGRG